MGKTDTSIQSGSVTNSKKSLKDAFFQLIELYMRDDEMYSRVARVESVDLENSVCTVEILDGAVIEDVRIQQETSAGLVIVPTVGSLVCITFTDQTSAYVSLHSEVDQVTYRGGENGGLLKIEPLLDDINTIKSQIRELRQVMAVDWVPVSGDGGLALKTALASWFTLTLPDTARGDVENDKFTH